MLLGPPHGLSEGLGKLLVVFGLAIAILGLALIAAERLHLPGLGHLPGDISWRGKSGSFYFPITTCLIASAALTLVVWAISSLFKR